MRRPELPAGISRWMLHASRVIVGLSILFALLEGYLELKWPAYAIYIPLIASIVLFGLPHGAVDHVVLLRLQRRRMTMASLVRVIAPYLLIALLYLALWFIQPQASFMLFILLTWYHWGQGDLHALLVLNKARHLPSRGLRIMSLIVRGGLPMFIPLVAFPEVYLDVAVNVTGVMRLADSSNDFGWIANPLVRYAGGACFALLVSAYAACAARYATGASREAFAEDLMEVVLLAVFFSVVHPLPAIGIYFCLWHAPRHILRIVLQTGPRAGGSMHTDVLPAFRQFARQATPITLLAMGLLAGLYAIVPVTPGSLPEYTGLYLIFIAVLTMPHVWVVSMMDRKESIWRPQ